MAASIKEELVEKFNLHTVVRLPNGVFSPYTLIPTNVLFFDRLARRKAGTTSTRSPRGGRLHKDAVVVV